MITKEGVIAGIIIAILAIAALNVIGINPTVQGDVHISQLMDEKAALQKQLNTANETINNMTLEISTFKGSRSYQIYALEKAGNEQIISIATWISTSGQETLNTVQWILENGQSALDLISSARKADAAYSSFRGTIGI